MQFSLAARDTAIAGIPRIVASKAAATVPEYEMSSQRLAPLFMPDIIISGFTGMSLFIAIFTQSEGVPFTINLLFDSRVAFKGMASVRARLIALCALSGATVQTSPRSLKVFSRHFIPSELIPSSLEIKIIIVY